MNKKIDVLLAEKSNLTSEFASQSTAAHVCFAASMIAFFFALIFGNMVVISSTYMMLLFFAFYELKIRKNYIESKKQIESEIAKILKIKPIKRKEVVGYLV
jgi:alpha-N-acetylglucosamine transferase